MKKFLVAIVGPTAVGKTAVTIELAKKLNSTIISADSRQFYRELKIGTAPPSREELKEVKHYFIHSHSIEETFSAGDFEREAVHKINKLHQSNNVVFVTGGSGLYIDALIKGMSVIPNTPENIREELNKSYSENGLVSLLDELEQRDPVYFNQVDKQNVQRVIRALEVIRNTGKPFSSFHQDPDAERPFQTIMIGLNLERDVLYERINMRVDQMVNAGLFDEAQKYKAYADQYALHTVGYTEVFDYLNGKYSYEEAIEKIKQNTRRYAKRQITWFKRYDQLNWFAPDETQAILKHIQQQMQLLA